VRDADGMEVPHVFCDHLLSKCFGKASCQRPAVSEELPAAKDTTIVTGRIGQLCAAAIPSMGHGCKGAERETGSVEHDPISAIRGVREHSDNRTKRPSALARATPDIAVESERYFPSLAAGAQKRRRKFGVAGGQRVRVSAERRGDALD
jgi:hypothetical protein